MERIHSILSHRDGACACILTSSCSFSPRIIVANWPALNSQETLLDMRLVFGWTTVVVLSRMIIPGVSRFLFSALWAHCLVLEVWLFANPLGMLKLSELPNSHPTNRVSFSLLIPSRWLLDFDHDEEGMVVIANLYGEGDIHNDKARQEYREIKMNVLIQRQEGERSYADMFRRYWKRVLIAMSAQAMAQLNGINVISYYAPLVFESAGWTGRSAILMTGINGITYLLSTIPPWYLVDNWGRRPILLCGAVAMVISLSSISYFIFLNIDATPVLTVIFVMIYNAAFGASWGPIPWLYPPEILPLSIRAKGASLSTASNWAFNWLVGEVTPVLQGAIKWRLYLVHAFFCACSFVLGRNPLPITANRLSLCFCFFYC